MNTNFAHTLALYDMRRGLWVSDEDLVEAFTKDGIDDVLIEQFTDCLSDEPMVDEYLLKKLNEFFEKHNFPIRATNVDMENSDIEQMYWHLART
jgi:hypothetical protein